ncbi:MAG TPA: Bro-N domain-containing protein [Syntrophorhabdaceae bacterium]|nr:Bro-N domain-containing protein [Syntrophorhabdaceae bacterium]HQM82370.1 Bro-N domain-containing protein [Syntrophorhabdaceae bacterium]
MTTQQTASAVPAVFQGNGEIRFHEVDGEFCLTIDDIGKGLGYEDSGAIRNLYSRHRDELDNFKGIIKLMTPGGMQEKTVFTEEGIYIISMLARTEKAKEFRQKVASLLKSLRQRKMEAIRTEAALALLDLQHSLGSRDMAFVERLIRYRKKGLRQWETGKILDVGKDVIWRMESRIRKAGLWEVL